MPFGLIKTPVLLVSGALVLSGCAKTQLIVHSAKELAGTNNKPVPKTKGYYKVGKPYRIQNTWYYPSEDFNYTETGIASWYGPKFHGRKTANGETFDMNTLTAAHRTLPMPSLVRVINLSNGRSLQLRVNDRGPFARNRIIDVSRRAAQLLGFQRQGTARVRVEIIADESQRMKLQAMNGKISPREQIVAGPVPRGNGGQANSRRAGDGVVPPDGNTQPQNSRRLAKPAGYGRKSAGWRRQSHVHPGGCLYRLRECLEGSGTSVAIRTRVAERNQGRTAEILPGPDWTDANFGAS